MSNNDKNDDIPDLEGIIALMPGNIYWKDRGGVYLGCNESIKKLLHLNHRNDIVGNTLYDLVPKDLADSITRIDNRVMETDEEYCIEETAFDPEGNEATYFTRKVPLKSTSGKTIGLVGISIDITERREHEKAIQIAREKAEAANKAKSAFIMNMSHDIRTPFSGLLGLSQFLLNNETDAEKKDILKSIVESAENLLDILNEVLDLTAAEEIQKKVLSDFDLKKLIKGIYNTMLPATKQKKLQLNLSLDPSLPKKVYGDEYAVKRILLNLLGNAVKFTNTGHINITASLVEHTDQNIMFELKVSDTGIGIPKEKQDFIFEQFSKLDSSYQGKYRGTGLGLWFVKQLVERMKGTLKINSTPSKGTSFTCILNVKEI